MTAISINGESIARGEQKTIMIPLPRLYDCAPLEMPVHVIRGKHDGPTLSLTAAIHGDELNGIEIIRRVLKKVSPKKLHGTLIAVPIVNMYGFLNQSRYLLDRRDLNRSFPGSEKGSLASRLAHVLTKEVIAHATHSIDLHTGSLYRSNLPQIRTNIDDAQMFELAKAFGAPVILNSKLLPGSFREYLNVTQKIPSLLYEAGESLRFDEFSIKTGVRGVLNVMHTIGLMPLERPPKLKVKSTIAKSNYWVRAMKSGVIQSKKQLGQSIEKGEVLATIGNPTTTHVEKLISPISGVIIGQNNLPIVHAGAAVYHIATFSDVDIVAEHIENLQEFFDESVTG